eukprot:gene10942-11096_t
MADGAGPSDKTGRAERKFKPTVTSRRKKAGEDGLGHSSAADQAAGNEEFQSLLRAAQTESKWERGRGGRGFGRGRSSAAATQQVTFGGGSAGGLRLAAASGAGPSTRLPGLREDSARVKQETKVKVKGGSLKAKTKGDKQEDGRMYPGASEGSEEGDEPLEQLFDYDQYFPTSLPVSRHHPLDLDADTTADTAPMRHGVPKDLMLQESGKVKLQIGDILLDVTAGLPCVARQDVVALNSHGKALVQLGPVSQRAVVCPDVWQLMSNAEVPSFPRGPGVGQQHAAAGLGEAADGAITAGRGLASEDGMDVDAEAEEAKVAATADVVRTRQAEASNGNDVGVDGINDLPSAEEGSAEAEEDDNDDDEEEDAESSEQNSQGHSPQAGQQQQQQQPGQQGALDPLMGVLGLPSARAGGAAGAGRGRGRFKPSATRAVAGIRKADAMDTAL